MRCDNLSWRPPQNRTCQSQRALTSRNRTLDCVAIVLHVDLIKERNSFLSSLACLTMPSPELAIFEVEAPSLPLHRSGLTAVSTTVVGIFLPVTTSKYRLNTLRPGSARSVILLWLNSAALRLESKNILCHIVGTFMANLVVFFPKANLERHGLHQSVHTAL